MGIKFIDGDAPPPEVQASEVQVGGDHYKKYAIQPAKYAVANDLGLLEGNVVKYITRYKDKGGVEDLQKAKHCIDLLIELKYK